MSEARLAPGSVDLLLQLLEAPQPILSGEALAGPYRTAAAPLMAGGLLIPAGYEAVATSGSDHDDAPVTLSRSDDGSGFGYFSGHAGWIDVPGQTITRHRLDIMRTLAMLTEGLDVNSRASGACIVEETLWDLGAVRLGQRPRRSSLWFARRLAVPGNHAQAREAARSRPSDGARIVLTSTRPDRCPAEGIGGAVLAWIPDVIEAGKELRIGAGVLAARLDMMPHPADASAALRVIGDGRIVYLHGREFRFEKGDTQRRIIMALHRRYLEGRMEVPSAEIVIELGLPTSARIRDYFKNAAHKGLIFAHGGLCGFNVRGEQRTISERER
jgi:hypothetical protein